jgi:hypothetical protein
MNNSEDEYITYVVVEQQNADQVPTQKQVKIMNNPEDERISYIAVEPSKANLLQGLNSSQMAG